MSADTARAFAPLHASHEFALVLHAYRQDYLRGLPAQVDAIENGWKKIEGSAIDLDCLLEIELVAHTIAGSAGTFGFGELSYKTRVLEYLMQELTIVEGPARKDYDRRISAAIASIRLALDREIVPDRVVA